jgi:hypothetical protein
MTYALPASVLCSQETVTVFWSMPAMQSDKRQSGRRDVGQVPAIMHSAQL